MGFLDKVKGKKGKDQETEQEFEVSFDEGYDDIEEEDYSQEFTEEEKPKGKTSKLSVETEEDVSFLSEDERKGLRGSVKRQDVDLDSEEQQQVLEREKLNELAEDMKYNDTKKPISYLIYKILNTTPLTTLILY